MSFREAIMPRYLREKAVHQIFLAMMTILKIKMIMSLRKLLIRMKPDDSISTPSRR